MELPIIGKRKEEEYFVSFVVGKNWIQAGIWNVESSKGTLISAGSFSPWQEDNPQTFTEGADDSLSSAIGSLQAEPKLEKAVFGLPLQWINDGQVKQEKLGLLKNLCEVLELKPSGFVVIPEALVFYLKQKEEGAGVSFILVGLLEDEIEITLVTAGKIIDTTYVARSITLGDDIIEGLARFGRENLPSRIILYDRHANELTEIKNELSTWEWPQANFAHTPRVETLPPDSVINAVSEAGAVEVAHVKEFKEETQSDESLEHDSVDSRQIVEEYQGEQEEEPNTEPQTISPEPEIDAYNIVSTTKEDNLEPQESKSAKGGKLPKISLPHIPIPKLSLPSFNRRPNGFILILAIFLITLGGALFVLPKANATIYLSPQMLEDKLNVIVSPTGEQNGKLPGRIISGELTGEKTKQTSGRKVVGDRAKGEVIIINNTSSPRTFQGGTVLTGPNGLKFILDSVVTVASESGAPTYKPGEAKASLTASDIGTEHNLASGNIFSIANFSTSSFAGRNDSTLSGGTSREVASIEKKDQENLEKELLEELKNQAIAQLNPQLKKDEILIPESTTTSVASRTFSGKVGDESETLGLRLTVRTDLLAISKGQLESYIRTAIESKIPSGLELQSGHIKVSFAPKEEEDEDNRSFTLAVASPLLPKIDKTQLVGKISGKTLSDAQKVFSNLPGFSRSSIKLSPSLPGPLNRFPFNKGNITIDIQPEE